MAIASFPTLVIDCPAAAGLARCCGAMLEWPIAREDDDWVEITADHGQVICFQQARPA